MLCVINEDSSSTSTQNSAHPTPGVRETQITDGVQPVLRAYPSFSQKSHCHQSQPRLTNSTFCSLLTSLFLAGLSHFRVKEKFVESVQLILKKENLQQVFPLQSFRLQQLKRLIVVDFFIHQIDV